LVDVDGAELDAVPAMEGDLADIGLPALIQMICSERRRSALVVQKRSLRAEVHFDGGEIVHATLGGLTGEAALHQLLTWREGIFEMAILRAAPPKTIRCSWDQLVAAGIRERSAALDPEGQPGEPDTVRAQLADCA
jgi:uncharacterized protein DUF4388